MNPERQVVMAMVHGGQLEWATVDSLIRTLAGDGDVDNGGRGLLQFVQTQSIYVPAARQQIALQFLEEHPAAEWLMFVDSDIQWTRDDVYRLYDSAYELGNAVMMGVAFVINHQGIVPAATGMDKNNVDWEAGGVVESTVVGTGFTLFPRSVLQEVQDRHGTMFAEAWEDQRFYGEDVAFSFRARECGYSLWVNCDVRVGHCKRVLLDEGWARASARMKAGEIV